MAQQLCVRAGVWECVWEERERGCESVCELCMYEDVRVWGFEYVYVSVCVCEGMWECVRVWGYVYEDVCECEYVCVSLCVCEHAWYVLYESEDLMPELMVL